MKSLLGGLLLLSIGSAMAQNNNINNNNNTTDEIFRCIAKLPKDVQCRILPYKASDGEEYFLFGISSISIESNEENNSGMPTTFLLSNYGSIHQEDENMVSFNQIAHIHPLNDTLIWQNVGKNAPQSRYCLKSRIADYMQYDGPNKDKLIIANLIVQGVPRGTSKSLLYIMPQCTSNGIESVEIEPVKDTEIISAVALAPNNCCAIAQKKQSANHISFFNVSYHEGTKPTLEPIGTPVVQNAAGIIKLMFLNASTLYALCHDGSVYRVNNVATSQASIKKQIFKDKNGQEIKIDQFALNPDFPNYGAFKSSNKLYLVNMRKQKFVCKSQIPKEQDHYKVGVFGHRQIGLYKLDRIHHLEIHDPVKVPYTALAMLLKNK